MVFVVVVAIFFSNFKSFVKQIDYWESTDSLAKYAPSGRMAIGPEQPSTVDNESTGTRSKGIAMVCVILGQRQNSDCRRKKKKGAANTYFHH